MRATIRPAAQADIEQAFDWYEEQGPGLGNEFLASLQLALKHASRAPLAQAIVHRDARRILLHRFPYALYYQIRHGAMVVLACMHGKRNPERWKARS